MQLGVSQVKLPPFVGSHRTEARVRTGTRLALKLFDGRPQGSQTVDNRGWTRHHSAAAAEKSKSGWHFAGHAPPLENNARNDEHGQWQAEWIAVD